MELLFLVPEKDRKRVEDLLLKDEVASKASIVVRSASVAGKEGFLVRVVGTPEQCKRAKELLSGVAEVLEGEEKEEAEAAMRSEDERMLEGLGSVFG